MNTTAKIYGLSFSSRNTERTVTSNAKVKVQSLSRAGRILGTPLKNTGQLWTQTIPGNKNKQEYFYEILYVVQNVLM
jgi:hypothetical protein